MSYLGDFLLGATVSCRFATVQSTGAPTTLSGSPVIKCYPSGSNVEIAGGITLTVDYDSRTGFNDVSIVASGGNTYAAATDYDIVITTGTVNSVSVVGYVVGTFSIQNRYLSPAVIATGVWQDTTAGDFTVAASVGKSVMNGVALGTGLTIAAVSGAVGSVTGAVGSVTGAVGSVTAAVVLPTIPNNWIAAAGIAAGAITNAKFGASAIDAAALATDAVQEIADGFLDRDMSTGVDSGSTTVRTARQALRVLRNKASISAGTLTVSKEDDATTSWDAAVTTAAGNPITAVDPTGP